MLLGSVVGTPEGVTGLAFVALFPLTFVASTFVPTETMPDCPADGRRVEPGHDPVRRHPGPVRQPQHTPVPPGDAWSTTHPVAYTLLWAAAIVAVCAPLAVRAYGRSVTR